MQRYIFFYNQPLKKQYFFVRHPFATATRPMPHAIQSPARPLPTCNCHRAKRPHRKPKSQPIPQRPSAPFHPRYVHTPYMLRRCSVHTL